MKIILIAVLSAAFILPSIAAASSTNGTIEDNYGYAWGEKLGWINFGCDGCDAAIADSLITGYAWSREYGWINLSPDNGGVTNNGEGVLSGYAWSSNLGWIDFSNSYIDANGHFSGTVNSSTGNNSGRITFDCDYCDIRTDWRPVSSRNASSAGGGSGISYTAPESTTTTPTNTLQEFVLTEGYLKWYTETAMRADVNQNGVIDLLDFNLLMVYWGTADIKADINQNGKVGTEDLTILLGHWNYAY